MRTKIIYVKWLDSSTQTGWLRKDEIMKNPLKCETVGFLVKENKKSLLLSLNRTQDENYKPFGDVICLPKKSIVVRKTLKQIKDK